MKWFKHISDSLDDPFIQDLMDEFGSDGYLVFFGVLEILSREFTDKSPGKVEVSHRYCTRKLRLSWHKISTILLFCQKESRFFVEDNGRKIIINCPKFKDMCDNWTKRKLCSSSVVTPKKRTYDKEVEGDKDKEVDKDINTVNCPYKKIIELYHSTLPALPEVSLNDDLKKRIKARWKEHKGLDWWAWYFDGVSNCPYLMGRVNNWAANFHWLTGPKNMTKVLNGQYVDRQKEKQTFDDFDLWLEGRHGEQGQQQV